MGAAECGVTVECTTTSPRGGRDSLSNNQGMDLQECTRRLSILVWNYKTQDPTVCNAHAATMAMIEKGKACCYLAFSVAITEALSSLNSSSSLSFWKD